MIKVYHAIGTGRFQDVYEIGLFDKISSQGVILPARNRVSRSQMRDRCYDLGPNLFTGCPRGNQNAYTALRDLAEEVIDTLPDDGDPHTKLVCLDLLAGDLDRIFLTVERWFGNIKNGFVFDAAQLIHQGAVVRDRDLLDDIHGAIEKVCKRSYSNVSTARRAIEASIRKTVAAHTYRGRAALELLEGCVKDLPCLSEVVWTGPLPLDAAVEAWRAGVRVHP